MYSYMHPIFTFCSHLVILKSIKNTKQGHVDGLCYLKSWLFCGNIFVLQVNIIGIGKTWRNRWGKIMIINHWRRIIREHLRTHGGWQHSGSLFHYCGQRHGSNLGFFCFCAWPQFNLLFKWVYWLHPFNKINNCVVLGWSAFPGKKMLIFKA